METGQLKLPPSPGAPLYPISPDRFNQQKTNSSPRASPEASPLHNKSNRNSADVQSRVAYFSNLSRADSPGAGSSTTTTAALQRAILGREEAEAALRTTQEQLSEANARERRVSERLESLMEELQSLKERQTHERGIYEKEVRKARKEAFRAGSTLLKAQEELKYSRGQMKSLGDSLQAEEDAKNKAKQEAFERAYALAGLTEELEVMRGKLRSSEATGRPGAQETKTEELRKGTPTTPVASRSGSSTPAPRSLKRSQPDSVDQKSPRRKRVSSEQNKLSPNIESPSKLEPSPTKLAESGATDSNCAHDDPAIVESLKSDLRLEQQLRNRAEDMVYFLKMECQFKRCSCRMAESRGVPYTHDHEWAVRYQPQEPFTTLFPSSQATSEPKPTLPSAFSAVHEDHHPQNEEHSEPLEQHQQQGEEQELGEGPHSAVEEQPSVIMTFRPDTGTFQSVPSPPKGSTAVQVQDEVQQSSETAASAASFVTHAPDHSNHETQEQMSRYEPEPTSATESQTHSVPIRQPFRKETTPVAQTQTTTSNTQTIPLHTENPDNGVSDPIPGTPVSREQALAQIRARRGRTQNELKRSASANDASTRAQSAAGTPIRGPKRIPRAEKSGLRGRRPSVTRRDISAPAGKY